MCQTGFEFAISGQLYCFGFRPWVDVSTLFVRDWSFSILAGYLNWEKATSLHALGVNGPTLALVFAGQ